MNRGRRTGPGSQPRSCMRIITERRIEEFCGQYPDAAGWLRNFKAVLRAAKWKNLADTKRVYPHADEVKVASGRTVTVFNAKGNQYRLILAIHYNKGWAYVRQFMPHKEYDRGTWKVIQ